MEIDVSNFSHLSNSQIIKECHNATALPSLIIAYLLAIVIFLFLGFTVEGSKKKFFQIWIWFTIIFGLIIIGLIFLPNQVQSLVDFFKNLFS